MTIADKLFARWAMLMVAITVAVAWGAVIYFAVTEGNTTLNALFAFAFALCWTDRALALRKEYNQLNQ